MNTPEPWRRFLAEFIGTALLVAAVVGASITASRLSPNDVGLQLLEGSTATALALAALIVMLAPVSGAHFNPVVSAADWYLGRRTGSGLTTADLAGYVAAQVVGGVAGAVLANLMFALPAVALPAGQRTPGHLWLGEVVATAGLVLLIRALVRSGRTGAAPGAVGAYIAAACWFTSSRSLVSPAVTLGRAFTGSAAGIAPAAVPGFVAAQVVGLLVGVALFRALFPEERRTSDDGHASRESRAAGRDAASGPATCVHRQAVPDGGDDRPFALPSAATGPDAPSGVTEVSDAVRTGAFGPGPGGLREEGWTGTGGVRWSPHTSRSVSMDRPPAGTHCAGR